MPQAVTIPWFGARKLARELNERVANLQEELTTAQDRLRAVGAMTLIEVHERRAAIEREISEQEWCAKTKAHLAELAGDLLEFHEVAEALKYRQGLTAQKGGAA